MVEPTPLAAGELRLSVIQIAPVYLNAQATWEKLKQYALEAVEDGAEIITWGESLLPGYPGWISIDTSKAQDGVFATYWDQALTLDGPIMADIKAFAATHGVMIIGGIAERHHGSIYATTITVGEDGELLGRHRKLKPTWRERLVWADGDGQGLTTHRTKIGQIGSLSCWENWLPLARAALHQQGEFVHIGLWPGSDKLVTEITRHIAKEGAMWSVAASGLLRPSDLRGVDLDLLPIRDDMANHPWVHQNGASQIVAPNGTIVAGPLIDEEGIITANIDAHSVITKRQIFDPSGHYSRNDVLDLRVDRSNRSVNQPDHRND